MKRFFTLLLAVASLTAVSCQKEQEAKIDNKTEKGLVKATFLARSPEVTGDTKTSLADNGSLYWSYGDHICVWDGTACRDFASSIQQAGAPTKVTTFTGDIQSEATDFIAVYPYSASVSYANSKIVTSIPATQYAVEGSFANQANVAIATGTINNASEDIGTDANALLFSNVGALVKFHISQGGVHKGVTIKAFTKAGEVKTYAKIAGEIQITPATAAATTTENSVDAVSVEVASGYLAAGDYYAVILPINAKYLSFSFTDGDKTKTRSTKTPVSIDRSRYYDMGTIDDGISYITLESIAVTKTPKRLYKIGDTFSFVGAEVTATYSNSSTSNVAVSCTTDYDGVTFNSLGVKTVTVSYANKSCTYDIVVAIVDELDRAFTGVTSGSAYSSWSNKSISGDGHTAVYAGNSAGGNGAIQIRTTSNNSGIVSTSSGGTLKMVVVDWNTNTTSPRTLNVYGGTSDYTAASQLYNTSTDGDYLGAIYYDTAEEPTNTPTTELFIESNDYSYVGLRSNNNALYLDKVYIGWLPPVLDPTISVTETINDVPAASGTYTINGAYTLLNGAASTDVTVSDPTGAITSVSKGEADGSVNITVSANTGAARTAGTFKIKYGTEDAHTITVNQVAATYVLTISSAEHGSVTATVDAAAVASGSAVAVGKTVAIATAANSGYALNFLSVTETVSGDPVSVTNNQFTMPACAVTVSATFTAVPSHTLTLTAPGSGYEIQVSVGGVVVATSSTSDATVDIYEENEVTIEATTIASGHTFSSWTVSGATVSGNTNPATFTMGTSDVTVEATFKVSSSTTTLTNANIVEAGDAADSYSDYVLEDNNGNEYSAYAIKKAHSKATSSYHFLQIKKYASSTAYYIHIPVLGSKITSIKMTVSSTSKAMDGGDNSATLYFSASNSTSATGAGVASGTGSSSVTIDCSSLNLNSGYITAGAAVRIWDIEITYTPSN